MAIFLTPYKRESKTIKNNEEKKGFRNISKNIGRKYGVEYDMLSIYIFSFSFNSFIFVL